MPRRTDINPADLETRQELLRTLKATREHLGIPQLAVARKMGIGLAAVSRFELRNPNPRISTVQRYARTLGHAAQLHLADLPEVDLDVHEDMLQRLARSTNPDVADAAHRSLAIVRLVATRHHLGLRQCDVADVIGITVNALHQIEADAADPILSTYQKYTRALGGQLTVQLQPVGAVGEPALGQVA